LHVVSLVVDVSASDDVTRGYQRPHHAVKAPAIACAGDGGSFQRVLAEPANRGRRLRRLCTVFDERKGQQMSPRIRVVVAKPGLDGHDRGAKVVARALRDAGMEVIYTGLHQTPEQIVETAIQEDADCIGLSVLSGAHMTLFARVLDLLRERHAEDVVVFGGGIIPEADIAELSRMGVIKVFTPGATTGSIVDWVTGHVGASERARDPA